MKTRHRLLHRIRLFLLTLGLMAATRLPAQPAATGVIEGRVLNTTAGDYLANVRVTVEGTALEAFTDVGGEFRITGVPAGSANVRVSYGGVTRQSAGVSVGAGQVATRNFEIAALFKILEGIT